MGISVENYLAMKARLEKYARPRNQKLPARVPVADSGAAAVVEPDSRHAPLVAEEVQGQAGARFLVRIESRRKRLIDVSNLCYKYQEDLCRYAGILPDDSPEICHSEVRQTKCAKGEAEQITVEVFEAVNL